MPVAGNQIKITARSHKKVRRKMKAAFYFLSAVQILSGVLNGQDIDKEIAKLDNATSSFILGQVAEQHMKSLAAAHQKKLDDLRKSGVQVILKDTVISVDKPMKIAFGWPVSAGLKSAGKKLVEREPFVTTLYPAKNEKGLPGPQKWEISFASGTIKALP